MLRSLMSRLRPSTDETQLGFGFFSGDTPDAFEEFADTPATGDATKLPDARKLPDATARAEDDTPQGDAPSGDDGVTRLFAALRALGLGHIRSLVLTRNRSVVVSVRGFEQRVHEGFVDAPAEMHAQIVRFVTARANGSARRRAMRSWRIPCRLR